MFSSHLLSEVERVSDRVAMIRSGRILFCDSMERIKESHARLTLRFESPRTAPPQLVGALSWNGAGQEWTAVCEGSTKRLQDAAQQIGANVVASEGVSLDEIFLARSGMRSERMSE